MNLLLLIAPTISIYAGLYLFQSVPVTFALFYGCLLLIPILFKSMGLRCLTYKASVLNISIGIGLGALCLVSIITGGVLFHNELFDSSQLWLLLKNWGFTGEYTVLLVLVLTLVNPVLEEMYWRGFILQKLDKIKYKVTISSLFYSLYHFLVLLPMFKGPYPVIFFLLVFLAGMIWGRMVIKYRTLWGSIISHSLADIGIIMIYFKYCYDCNN
ncbi:CPBP family intramembrane metalloprotease [Paenibacillus sp. SYP-B3998]|uniref:CPBP family intramembrane metalloprotease n=1 Tax=Paenibacillus sp. SYP-B3998 TaxID=2678564 RepID=A0A6G3ZVM9_9BACL|nr:CPBP family intramembrane glutamic endopeptidase [Paenibacillus sp. SYP-B3998]NEW05649.1 CPBP family intramembrane metalloprotease [Paenibacillus sp. SYP-B3998]